MSSTSIKKPKSKPTKFTKFFQSPFPLPQDLRKPTSIPPSSPTHAVVESVDLDMHDFALSNPPQEHSLQQLFDSFRPNLQTDFKAMILEFKADIQALVSHTDHMEKKMAEFAKLHNALIDSHSALEEEVARLSAKVLDLEDCFRRNNICIRGIFENVALNSLCAFLMDLMASVLPSCNQLNLTLDRIHRIPKPKNISPRDIIARIHFFHVKDDFPRALRKAPTLPERFQQLCIYPDLSAVTMLHRKELSPYTKILRDNNIQYC